MFFTMGTPSGSASGICGILTQPLQPLKQRLVGVTFSPALANSMVNAELERARQIANCGRGSGAQWNVLLAVAGLWLVAYVRADGPLTG